MNRFFTKSKKTLFLGIFGPKLAQKNFFSKIGLRHILGITILHLFAKNHKKQMSQSREKLVTDKRTDERTDTGEFKGPPGRSKKGEHRF